MTQEYYARVNYVYDGDTSTFSIPFSYINPSHVVVIINEDTENPITNITFNTASQITFDVSGLNVGDKITICRTTPLDERMVQFTDGNILDEETQNLSAEQVFDCIQEVTDYNDWLISKMTEFVELKNYIDSVMSGVNDAINAIDTATEYYKNIQNLVDGISSSYEEVQQQIADGLKTNVTRNLFELVFTDKTLSGEELTGLAFQGTTVDEEDCPSAYAALLNEYNNGTDEIYVDDDISTYYKGYTGETTGKFYIASTDDLVEDTTVYAPIFDISKFSKEGNPTISDDGIASDFSSSNYVTNIVSLTNGNEIKVIIKLTTGTFDGSSSYVVLYHQYFQIDLAYISVKGGNMPRMRIYDGNEYKYTRPNNVVLQEHTTYIIEASHNNTTTKSTLKLYNENLVLLDSTTSNPHNISVPHSNITGFEIGKSSFNGSIDLKSIDIELDGNIEFSGKPDINLIDEIGTLASDAETLTVNKFTDENSTDFYTLGDLAEGVTVYSNEACTTSLGTVTDLVDKTVNKYTFSSTGVVYTSSSENLEVGTVLYSDKTLLTQAGYISAIKTVSSVKYSIAGLDDYDYFYVPKDTVVQTGTTIYSDAACTKAIGTVSSKGSITTNTNNYYYFDKAPYGYQITNKTLYGYTKNTLSSTNQYVYKDAACTVPYKYQTYPYQVSLLNPNVAIITAGSNYVSIHAYKLISSSSQIASTYIVINGVQCTYFMVSTVEGTAYQINSGSNESYILNETKNYKSIKIGSGSYKTYSVIGEIEVLTVEILYTGESVASVEKAVYNGLEAVSGVLFEYKQAANGHKIVNSLYKSIVAGLTPNPYYAIDIDNKQLTLPHPYTGQYVYYCIGNTVTVQSNVLGVTQAQLAQTLTDYVKYSDEELTAILNVVTQYNTTVGDIDSALGEIIGE